MVTKKQKVDTPEKPAWVTLKPAEVEKIVVDLHKQGESPARIGLILRDKHGIPKAKLLGKRVQEVLLDTKQKVVAEQEHVQEKIKKIESHLAKHKHDYTAKRSLIKKQWVITKLAR